MDVDDRCWYLPRECLAGFDPSEDDGCPDPPPPALELPGGSIELPPDAAPRLDAIAADARRLADGATLLLIVEGQPWETDEEIAARGALVTDALVARGAPAARIAVEPVPAGEAAARVVVGVDGCAFVPAQLDADGDGILDHRDACPDDPEDRDDHLDDDGCPDVDRDCHPADPEAADATCGDRDHDGVLDAEDRCPDAPGPAAGGGCPRPRAPGADPDDGTA